MNSQAEVDEATTKLHQFFESETESLLKTLRFYVFKAKLAHDPTRVEEVALELLNEVFIEAIEHADRLGSSKPCKAWLLVIAANLIKRRQVETAKRTQREVDIDEIESQLFDVIASPSTSNIEIEIILQHLSEQEQELMRVALKHNLKGKDIAEELGISPGNARVRLHRAISKLRELSQK